MIHVVAIKTRNCNSFRVFTDPLLADEDFQFRVQRYPTFSIYRFDLPLFAEHGAIDAAQELADKLLVAIDFDYSKLDIIAEHPVKSSQVA